MKPLEDMGKFATVVIDPPWPLSGPGFVYGEKDNRNGISVKPLKYATMTIQDIADLPIANILADDAFVFCWTVNKYLLQMGDIAQGWGCKYRLTMSWIKPGGINLPNTPCFNTEWAVLFTKGSPRFLDTKSFRTGNFWDWNGSGVKPEGFYDLLRRVTPAPRLDIFGRRRIAGFTSWGNEAPEGEPLPDHYQQVLIG